MVACQTGDAYSHERWELMFLLIIFHHDAAMCLFQVWSAVRSDLVVPAAGHTGM